MSLKYEGRFGDAMLYRMGECSIFLSGPLERSEIGWHFSISCEKRNPTWEEQKLARYQLIPDSITMVSVMPPKDDFVNIHMFCFHWLEAGPKFFDPHTGLPRK